jgi:hypothetical protein
MGKNTVSRFLFLVMGLLLSVGSIAQDKPNTLDTTTTNSIKAQMRDKPEMADVMRSNGKIYVVVAVCLTILIGLFLYIMRLDMKMRKIEKNKHAE